MLCKNIIFFFASDPLVKFVSCNRCTFCARALPKERAKSWGSRLSIEQKSQIKVCEKCFLCHSIVLCPTCKQCPKCCTKITCRGQTSKPLANLAGSGCRPESSSNVERRLLSPLSDPAKTDKIPHCRKLLCTSPQEQLPVGGIASADRQKCSGASTEPNISRAFQPTVFGSKTKQQVETHSRPVQVKSLSQGGEIQNGNTRNHQNLPSARGVGHIHRLQRRLLPYSTGTVQEVSRVSCPRPDIQFKALPFGLSTAPMEFTVVAKEVKLMAIHKGIRIHQYLDDWLVRARSHQVCLQHTQTLVKMCQDLGWLVNLEKSEEEPKQVFNFVGYQFDLRSGRVRPTPDRWQNLQEKLQSLLVLPACPAVYVPDRIVNSHRETSSPRSVTYEAHPVVPQKQLASTGITGKGHSYTQDPRPSSTMVAGRKQCAPRSTVTPNKTCSADLYRRIKRRMGRSLKRTHCKRVLVPARKQAAYKLSGTKSSFPSIKRFPGSLLTQDSTGSNRQHYSSVLHKQGRGYEVGPTVCPAIENLGLVYQTSSDPQSPTYSRPAECGRGQAIQARPGNSDNGLSFQRFFKLCATGGTDLK